MVGRVIEVTLILVMAYLVLANANSFGTVTRAIGSTYIGAVKVLQGR